MVAWVKVAKSFLFQTQLRLMLCWGCDVTINIIYRHLGTIVRSLGYNPTNDELQVQAGPEEVG